jgi:hypothetical protein
MTTAELIIYDIIEIKNALEDDRDLDELWLLNKINMYRSMMISADYAVNHEIQPGWLQRLRKQKVTKVNSADDPSITVTSIDLGKVTLPAVVNLPDDVGLRLSGSSGIFAFDEIDFDTLMLKINFNEERNGQFGYFAMVGNDAFIWPLVLEIQAIIIAENPFDVQVLDSTTGLLRAMTIQDDYPCDAEMAQKIIMEILTKDLQLNAQSISDIVNDAQNALKLLQNGGNQKQPVE